MERLQGEHGETLCPVGFGVTPHHEGFHRAEEDEAFGNAEANENGPEPSQSRGVVITTHEDGRVGGGGQAQVLRAECDVFNGARLRHNEEEGTFGDDPAHDNHDGDDDRGEDFKNDGTVPDKTRVLLRDGEDLALVLIESIPPCKHRQ